MQQYSGPLYDLDMASINLNWESDLVNHQPAPENQNMCIYGDPTGFSYRRSFDANGIRIVDDTALLAECRNPISVLFLGDSFNGRIRRGGEQRARSSTAGSPA